MQYHNDINKVVQRQYLENLGCSVLTATYLDFLWWQEVPVCLQVTTLYLLIINLHLVCVVWAHNQRVQMGEDVILKNNLEQSLSTTILTICKTPGYNWQLFRSTAYEMLIQGKNITLPECPGQVNFDCGHVYFCCTGPAGMYFFLSFGIKNFTCHTHLHIAGKSISLGM